METPRPPFSSTPDSDLYNTTAQLNHDAFNQSVLKQKKSFLTELTVCASVISSIEIPVICLAIYAVYSLNKSKQAAPVFVINLLTSDLIQIVCILLLNIWSHWIPILIVIIAWAGFTSLYFMTCIAIERYVLIAHPIWHRSHRSVKCLVCTSLTGWLISSIVCPVCLFINELLYVMLLIPYAVIIVCFIGICRALSHSISLSPLKKQIVLAPLLSVVINYTFVILPLQICLFLLYNVNNFPPNPVVYTFILYMLNPLVDCLLYVFMRSDAENIVRTHHCCSRLKRVRSETGQTTSTEVQLDHV